MTPIDTRKAARMRRESGDPSALLAFAYARVSTDMQVEGLSLEWQERVLVGEVERRGWRLAGGVVRESASAKNLGGRPLLVELLRALDAGEADVLVVAKLDRLSRSARDFYDLMDRAKRRGWSVLCLDPQVDMTSPFGEAMAGMAAVFAQLERRLIAQRTREGIAARKAAGAYVAPPRLVSSDAEEHIGFLASDGRGARAIARQRELEGFEPPAGRRWYPTSVARIAARLEQSSAGPADQAA
jgi:DNA invertase Pin-like site-specific DNA recombinase